MISYCKHTYTYIYICWFIEIYKQYLPIIYSCTDKWMLDARMRIKQRFILKVHFPNSKNILKYLKDAEPWSGSMHSNLKNKEIKSFT